MKVHKIMEEMEEMRGRINFEKEDISFSEINVWMKENKNEVERG